MWIWPLPFFFFKSLQHRITSWAGLLFIRLRWRVGQDNGACTGPAARGLARASLVAGGTADGTADIQCLPAKTDYRPWFLRGTGSTAGKATRVAWTRMCPSHFCLVTSFHRAAFGKALCRASVLIREMVGRNALPRVSILHVNSGPFLAPGPPPGGVQSCCSRAASTPTLSAIAKRFNAGSTKISVQSLDTTILVYSNRRWLEAWVPAFFHSQGVPMSQRSSLRPGKKTPCQTPATLYMYRGPEFHKLPIVCPCVHCVVDSDDFS